jgi:hypothetical protein
MKTSLTAGLTPQQKSEIVSSFLASARLRERLINVLTDKLDARRRELRQTTSYENANWAYTQADLIGYERAVYELISLLSSKSNEKNDN